MLPAGCFTLAVVEKGRWIELELIGNESRHVGGKHFSRTEHPGGLTQVGEVDSKAKPVCSPASLPNQRQIFHRERVMANDGGYVRRWVEQSGARLRREDFVLLHGSPVVWGDKVPPCCTILLPNCFYQQEIKQEAFPPEMPLGSCAARPEAASEALP